MSHSAASALRLLAAESAKPAGNAASQPLCAVNRWLALIALCLLVSSLGCSYPGGKEDSQPAAPKVVAKVNGRTITDQDLETEFKHYKVVFRLDKPEIRDKADKLRKSLLSRLVDNVILEMEADRLGVAVTPGELDVEVKTLLGEYDEQGLNQTLTRNQVRLDVWKKLLERNLRIKKLIVNEVESKIRVTEAEIKEYFDKNAEDFKLPERLHVMQIMVKDEAEAVNARKKLLGRADFATIAKERSQSPDAAHGGDLGFYSRGQLPPEFETAVFNLKEGDISDVVRSIYGLHIFKVVKKEKPRSMTFAEAREKILDILKTNKRDEEFAGWLAKIKSGVPVTIYP
jgi:parvulin-like peptidyl-prolyl isomerase